MHEPAEHPESRAALARQIARRLDAHRDALQQQWRRAAPVAHFVLDDAAPAAAAGALAARFPARSELLARRSLRERKGVGVEVERYSPVVGEFLFAFQQPAVLAAVAAITGLPDLEGDPSLYASGVSVMTRGDFLNPHLDNSHDGDGHRYRALNLLYYASPDWDDSCGGELELWEPSLRTPHAVPVRGNRLVVMATDPRSWHSVHRVTTDRPRCCVSNYFFTATPPGGAPYRHVTSFAGRPEERGKRLLLALDARVLNAVGRLAPFLTRRSKHRRR